MLFCISPPFRSIISISSFFSPFFLLPCPSSSPSLPYNLLHKVVLSYGLNLWALRFSSIFELTRMKLARNFSITSADQRILQNDEGSLSRRLWDPFQAPTCCAPALPIVLPLLPLLPRCSPGAPPVLTPKRLCSLSRLKMTITNPKFGVYI